MLVASKHLSIGWWLQGRWSSSHSQASNLIRKSRLMKLTSICTRPLSGACWERCLLSLWISCEQFLKFNPHVAYVPSKTGASSDVFSPTCKETVPACIYLYDMSHLYVLQILYFLFFCSFFLFCQDDMNLDA